MRSMILGFTQATATAAGVASLIAAAVVFVDGLRDDPLVTDWFDQSLGLAIMSTNAIWLLILGLLCFIVALLAFIAETVAAHSAQPTDAPATWPAPVLPEQRPAWSTQESRRP